MKLDYSEFSFGYAFTENFLRRHARTLRSAPVFPNLLQEAEVGYDVRIDLPAAPLFFQFKLPELVTRKSRRGAQAKIKGLSIPYFVVEIMPLSRSHQHDILVDLERRMPGAVFYASPRQTCKACLDFCYIKGCVHRCAAWISPAQIGPLQDNGAHKIIYEPYADYGWFCSEPRKVDFYDIDQLEPRLVDSFENRRRSSLRTLVREIRRTLLGVIPPLIANSEDVIRRAIRDRLWRLDAPWFRDREILAVVETLLLCRDLARIALGLELIIAQPGSSRSS